MSETNEASAGAEAVEPDGAERQEDAPEAEGGVGATEEGAAAAEAAREQLEQAQAEAADSHERYLRAVAELENVRRRAQLDLDKAHKFAIERFVSELLSVRDSLEMGLAAATAAPGPVVEGMQATHRQLTQVFEKFGVTELDPAGEPFDPDLHEAMSVQDSGEVAPNAVITVFQKGYQLNGRLVRPARVIVAKS